MPKWKKKLHYNFGSCNLLELLGCLHCTHQKVSVHTDSGCFEEWFARQLCCISIFVPLCYPDTLQPSNSDSHWTVVLHLEVSGGTYLAFGFDTNKRPSQHWTNHCKTHLKSYLADSFFPEPICLKLGQNPAAFWNWSKWKSEHSHEFVVLSKNLDSHEFVGICFDLSTKST